MNYARLPLEELEELVKQQGSWLQELEEALLNGRRAYNEMLSALACKRVDATFSLCDRWVARLDVGTTGAQTDRAIATNFADLPPRATAFWEKQEQEYRAKREMMALLNRVGDKYELL